MPGKVDLLLVNPGNTRKKVYQDLSKSFSAIEPPFWAALTAGFIREKGYNVDILDANACNLSHEETVEKINRLSKSDIIKELEKIHRDNIKTVKPEELTGALKGRYAMLQHLESMLKKSKKSVKMMTTEAGLMELSEHHFQHLKKASDSGVKIQLVAPITKQNAGVAKDLSKFATVRDISNMEHVEKLLGRLVIVDGQEFIIGLTDDVKVHPTQDVAFWSQSSHVAANTIEPMFDLVWKFAKPVEKK